MIEPAIATFDPAPAPADVPARLASPFDPGEPHPLARRAAVVVVIEGPRGAGRATAAACAWGGDVLVLDCARLANDPLAAPAHNYLDHLKQQGG